MNAFQVQSQTYKSLTNDQIRIDSLQAVYAKTKSDSLKCITAFKLSNIYYKNNDDKQFKTFLNSANRLIKGNNFLKDLSYYYNAIHLPLSNKEDEIQNFKTAYELANLKLKKHQLHEVYSIRSTILFNLALVYQRQNNDLDAIKILLNEAIPLAKKANDKIEMANLYRFLGLIFYNKNDLQKAAEYVGLAIKTLEAKKLSHENYAEDLLQFYLFYVEICSLQNKLSEASNYLQKAKSLLDNHPDSNLYIDYYSAKGTLENQYKNYRNAIAIFDLGIAKAQLVNDTYSVINFKLLKFESLKELKQYDQAKNLLLEVLSNREVNVEDRKNYSKDLSLIYKQLGDYKNAILYSERYMSLSDSLDKISNKNEIANLEARYKSKENENKIKELEIQKQQALLTSRNDRMNYIVFGLISFILLLVTIFLIKNSKNQKRIAAQKEINYHQKLNALEIQKALEVMQAMIGGEEAERKRIARDLHDGIGSRLSALKMQVQSVTSNTNSTSILEDFSESLSLSIIELRQIAFNLMPETLLKLGLELALKDLCHSLNRENVTIDFQANEISKSIKANDQVTIFRIVQELINNALKHSHCSEIIVDCSQNRDLFLITVEDNGKGFNPEELEQYKGLGLKNIKNRVELLKGKLDIQSRPESGTVFNIELLLQSYDE